MAHLGSFPHTFEDGPGNTASGEEVMDNLGFLKDGVDAVDDRVGTLESSGPADGTVDTGALATGAVTSAKIADGTIVAGDIADGAVTAAKILDGTIGAAELSALLQGTAAPQVVDTLPGSPTNNQEVFYIPTGSGNLFHLKYMAYLGGAWKAAADGGSGYGNWICIGGTPIIAQTDTFASCASVTYTNPSVGGLSISLPLRGSYVVRAEALIQPYTGAAAWMSYKIGSTAASDGNACVVSGDGALDGSSVSKESFIAIDGAKTITEQIRGSTTNGPVITNRRLIAMPIAVG